MTGDAKKGISQAPLNLLFNPSLLARKDVWSVDVALLLQMFLQLINATGSRDLRICGIAALSSSLIYRLKVESIFALEKIAMQRAAVQDPNAVLPIPELNPVELPYRVEPTYPVSLEELLRVLENMVSELANPRPRKKQLELEPVQTFNFDQYLLKFEQIIQGYEDMIFDIVSADGTLMFRTLVAKMNPFEMARCFIAMLYLAMKGRVDLEPVEEELTLNTDVKILMASENVSSQAQKTDQDSKPT